MRRTCRGLLIAEGTFMITMQTYVQAQSLEEAWQLNQKRSARILGGMLWTRMDSRPVSTAIDLCRLGLDTIEETDAAFTLGAMVTLRQIELHPGLAAYTGGAAAAAVRDIVGVQFRNMATIGGSVWGRFGFSDLLTWLLASGAAVELYKGGVVPLVDAPDVLAVLAQHVQFLPVPAGDKQVGDGGAVGQSPQLVGAILQNNLPDFQPVGGLAVRCDGNCHNATSLPRPHPCRRLYFVSASIIPRVRTPGKEPYKKIRTGLDKCPLSMLL